ncbi:MAG: Flp pilus assembly protein CpaB [Marinosulfonomonas sp.]|nr:Flp pilus assembly protein CpaB [Marinosulfonomonas sp.]
MRMVFGLVLIFGVGLAGFAVYTARGYFSTVRAETERLQVIAGGIVETVNVFVVKRKVRYGERLSQEDVRIVRWPVDALPKGVFTFPAMETEDGKPGENLFPKGESELRTVWRTMEINELVMTVKVTKPGQNVNITSRLAPGMRAFTIKVDVNSSVSGFVRPGDKVDVYWTGRPPNNRSGGNITKLIQPAVDVIAINQSADDDISGTKIARTVTVEVSPRQVATLAQAQGSGRLTLSLLGYGDTVEIDTAIEIDQADLLGIEATEAEVKEAERKCYITVTKNGEKVKTEIPCRD